MSRKVKVKIPDQSSWPQEFWGKEVEVEINQITLPDGAMWTCDDYSYPIDVVGSSEGESKVSSIKAMIGQEMESLNIQFRR